MKNDTLFRFYEEAIANFSIAVMNELSEEMLRIKPVREMDIFS